MTTYEAPTLWGTAREEHLSSPVRMTDPDTSRTAAEMTQRQEAEAEVPDRQLVLDCLNAHHGRGSAGQITYWLNRGERQWQRNVVASRLSQLKRRKLIEDSGQRIEGEGKRPTIVWRAVR